MNATTNPRRLALVPLIMAALFAGAFVATRSRPELAYDLPQTARIGSALDAPATADQIPTDGAPARLAAREGCYWAPAGSRLSFELTTTTELSSTATDEQGKPRTQGGSFATRGRLDLLVLARRGRELLVQAQCADLRTGDASRQDAELTANLAAAGRPTLLRMDADGRIAGYRFADQTGAAQRNFLRGLFGTFEFVVPADADGAWTATGADSTGEYEATYVATARTPAEVAVQRTKLRYTPASAVQLEPRLGGAGTATLDLARLGWIRTATVDETMHLTTALAPVEFDVHHRATLALVATATVPVAAEPDWEAEWSPAGGHAESVAEQIGDRERSEWEQKLAGVDVAALHAELAELLASGRDDSSELHDAWQKATWLLRLHPERAADVLALLADPSLAAKHASLWLTALATSGSDPAQAAVLAVFGNPALGADTRAAAGGALFEIRAPSRALLEALSARVGGLSEVDGIDATGLLALGAFARRDAGRPVAGRPLVEVVEQWGESARRLGAEDLWLDALANARAPRLAREAQRLLSDARDDLRAAAARALREVDAAQAIPALRRCAAEDASIHVRATALEALASRPEPEARAAVTRALALETSAEVRRVALLALAKSGVRANDRAALEAVATSDADPDLRSLARRMLGNG